MRTPRAADTGVVSTARATAHTGAVVKPCERPARAAGPKNANPVALTGGIAALRGTSLPSLDTLALVFLLTNGSRSPEAGAVPALTPGVRLF